MPRSNYGRFRDGLSVNGVTIQVPHVGKTFYVNNSTTAAELQPYGIGGSDGNHGETPERPFSTIDKAINSCAAGRGDTIYVLPGHAETVTTATDIVPDVSHINIIGLGKGEKRPIITFATNTTANIPVSGANTRISNMVFKVNVASQVAMITTTGTDIEIDHCSFREGSSTGLNFITVGAADNDSDRVYIHDCDFYMPTAGNGDHAIEFLFDMLNARLEDLEIDGNFDEGGILIPAAGDAQANLRILRCNVKNRLTNVGAIDIDGTDSTGLIQDCLLRTDTQSTALDSGSLAVDNVRWADETDQVSAAISILSPLDSATNFIGVDDAANLGLTTSVTADRDGSILERLEDMLDYFADDTATNFIGVDDGANLGLTTNVTSDADGSILERLEYIQANATPQTPATFVPGLGFRVTKTEDVNTATTDALFTVTGKVLVTLWEMEVTNALAAGVTDYALSLTTFAGTIKAAGNIASAIVGFMRQINSDSGDTSLSTSTDAVTIAGVADTNGKGLCNMVIGIAGGSDVIKSVRTAGDAGDAIVHTLFYLPLEAGASVAAAA